ncbi:MAG: hypothetical protein KDD22_00760, partial [Bdellovibrionales bacterium]|nr:hypothetical protein [Bdellovibrionales bacterium]
MKQGLLIITAILLFPLKISPSLPYQLIIWNVGQGQWVTLRMNSKCLHLDAGGEIFNWMAFAHDCGGKQQQILFTHADWDHISFSRSLQKRFPLLCTWKEFEPREATKKARKVFAKIPPCSGSFPKYLKAFLVEPLFLQGRR